MSMMCRAGMGVLACCAYERSVNSQAHLQAPHYTHAHAHTHTHIHNTHSHTHTLAYSCTLSHTLAPHAIRKAFARAHAYMHARVYTRACEHAHSHARARALSLSHTHIHKRCRAQKATAHRLSREHILQRTYSAENTFYRDHIP